MPTPFQVETLYDALGSFEGGVNEGASPLRLPPGTMAGSVNVTVRGDYPMHRSPYFKRIVTYADVPTQTAFETGHFQGACVYLGDDGKTSLVALVSGRLFQFSVQGNIINGAEVPIVGGPQNVSQPQAWLWQSEKWVIVQDGLSNPIFFDGTTAVRSNYSQPVNFTTVPTGDFTIPAVGASVVIPFTDVSNILVGDIITLAIFNGGNTTSFGTFQVLSIAANNVTCANLTATPLGSLVPVAPVPATISWTHKGTQLPPGRMGCYGLGRNWFALADGKQFVAGDVVGGASGTVANNFRDAVLNITENQFLVGGGNFTVPGSVGAIQAMRFVSTLDASLGQGPLQVFTNDRVFSCAAPVDRLTWQSVTNPILTESLIANGAKGQNSTVLANGDAIFRSVDGIRSLILARREFATWGNVPISFEVMDTLSNDDPGLLTYGSAIVFDNRLLMTVGTTQDEFGQGVYFQGLLALNFDPLSSLRGKEPSVWDGLWTGLNVMQLLVGEVTGVERAFAFVLDTATANNKIEIWEIGNTFDGIADNDGVNNIPITWRFDSASMRFGVQNGNRKYMNLNNGEVWVEDVQGTVNFTVQYRPDQFPCWTNWFAWSACNNVDGPTSKPGFKPRMGLGSPSPDDCDASTNRPMRNGFTFQTRTIITGHCVFLGAFYEAKTQPMAVFAPMQCDVVCP